MSRLEGPNVCIFCAGKIEGSKRGNKDEATYMHQHGTQSLKKGELFILLKVGMHEECLLKYGMQCLVAKINAGVSENI